MILNERDLLVVVYVVRACFSVLCVRYKIFQRI